ncbi:MAG: DUF3105 domain-containing protein [Actinomycetota bacterium]
MAKKKRKRSSGPSQVDRQELKQQRLEARRQAKAEAEIKRRKAERRERLVRYLMMGLIGAGAFWFVFIRTGAPSEINGHAIETLSSRGSGQHVTTDISYESSPPVSGQHAPRPTSCGVFNSQVPDETQVHNLEHGTVAIQYQPTLPIEQIRRFEEFAEEYDTHILVAPYPDLETPIAVSSWSRLMRLDEVDEDAIRQYIEEFRGKGPEPDQPCPNAQDAPFQEPQEQPVDGDEGNDGAGDETDAPGDDDGDDGSEGSPSP